MADKSEEFMKAVGLISLFANQGMDGKVTANLEYTSASLNSRKRHHRHRGLCRNPPTDFGGGVVHSP